MNNTNPLISYLTVTVNGTEHTAEVLHTHEEETEDCSITLSVVGETFHTEENTAEYAFKKLTEILPVGMKIHSCYTCRHGNFNPLGDFDNEIFCLHGHNPESKSDVVGIMMRSCKPPRHSLFYCCERFEDMADGYYTYK